MNNTYTHLNHSLVTVALPENLRSNQNAVEVKTVKKAPNPKTVRYPIHVGNGASPPKYDVIP